ncbi:MAG TPA: hypothetical protein VKU02_18805 [Gemmataceae bacterium]|nr:hypothetical protein [Gemmataceae bacterium]
MSTITKMVRACFTRTERNRQPARQSFRSQLLLEELEVRAVPTVLFQPVLRGAEAFDFNGTTMARSVNNPYALNSPKVYFIFVGANWQQKNGQPTAAVNSMVADVKAIFSSPYLGGLKQYGSNGQATYGGMTIDTSLNPLTWSKVYTLSDGTTTTTNNPMWYETGQILSNPKFASWNPPGKDARQSPIYVVARYSHDGTGVGGGYGGSNNFGPNDYTSSANGYTANPNVNVIDIAITSADQVDEFSWTFSHEIAERMSNGTGNQSSTGVYEVSPDQGAQICDGEPEGNDFYAVRLNGPSGPVVTSYWSVVDQAFIVPDGHQQNILLYPAFDNSNFTGQFVSLQGGNLYGFTGSLLDSSLYQITNPGKNSLIDTNVQSFTTDIFGNVYYLNNNGQVRLFDWVSSGTQAFTDSHTYATALVEAHGGIGILASKNGGPSQVWFYQPYSLTTPSLVAVTGTNTNITQIAAAGDGPSLDNSMFILANNGGPNQVWEYSGFGTDWTPVTTTNMDVQEMYTPGNLLYLFASNNGLPSQVWEYSGTGTSWTAVTSTNMSVDQVAASPTILYLLAANNGGPEQVWQYALAPKEWNTLTTPNTKVDEIVTAGIDLYMLASNSGGPNQVWQYSGTPHSWTALTSTNSNAAWIGTVGDVLYMMGTDNQGSFHEWMYDGAPAQWTQVW